MKQDYVLFLNFTTRAAKRKEATTCGSSFFPAKTDCAFWQLAV